MGNSSVCMEYGKLELTKVFPIFYIHSSCLRHGAGGKGNFLKSER